MTIVAVPPKGVAFFAPTWQVTQASNVQTHNPALDNPVFTAGANGDELVFVRSVDGHGHLFVEDLDGKGGAKDITPSATADDTEPTWSANGGTIAFVPATGGVDVICATGGAPTRPSGYNGAPAYRG